MQNFQQDSFTLNLSSNLATDDIQKLFGIGPTHNSDGYDVTYSYLVPRRKHKKRRINKKWLKRYGTEQKFITLKGCEVTRNSDEDGVIEFSFNGKIVGKVQEEKKNDHT